MLICFFHDLGYNVEEGKSVALEEDGVFPPRWETPIFLPRIYTRKAVSAYEKYREQGVKIANRSSIKLPSYRLNFTVKDLESKIKLLIFAQE
jgi:hypothetical protein